MIKCERDNVTIEGTGCQILAEVSELLRVVREAVSEAYEDERLTDELLCEAFRMSKMTGEELRQHRKNTLSIFFEGGVI